ncbi:hypothetical protein NOR_06361 [Metarhizium rileyi]|uniref:Uncharacterized protein n=1 Tax=Metarhizium rileyi (strain RCEF 4871) TaxID=1649241 RepID=A0A167AND1_METRR|nr:hypothetical protein NOR_06361 [Metarhizium rileyi RCEF 4871]
MPSGMMQQNIFPDGNSGPGNNQTAVRGPEGVGTYKAVNGFASLRKFIFCDVSFVRSSVF